MSSFSITVVSLLVTLFNTILHLICCYLIVLIVYISKPKNVKLTNGRTGYYPKVPQVHLAELIKLPPGGMRAFLLKW